MVSVVNFTVVYIRELSLQYSVERIKALTGERRTSFRFWAFLQSIPKLYLSENRLFIDAAKRLSAQTKNLVILLSHFFF
jgi:hypothetical protein